MKFLISAFLFVSGVSASADNYFWSDSVTSEWGLTRSTKRNLRGPQLRVLSEMSTSMSMSLSDELDFPGSMSMLINGDADFEQFEVLFDSSMSMSLPSEFEQFDEANSISMSIPYLGEVDFEQFGLEFDHLSSSMSMMYGIQQDEFEKFEEEFSYSMSMSLLYKGEVGFEQFQADFDFSISFSTPGMAEEEFGSSFGSSLSMSAPNEPESPLEDTFFLMPLFDDRTDVVEPETLDNFSISMSMTPGDLSEWASEKDFEFLTMEEFSVSMSLSMP